MNKLLKYTICSFTVLATTAFFTACKDNNANEELQAAIYPGTVTMTLPDAQQKLIYTDATGARILPLITGESVTLGYSIAPDNITFSDVKWLSSDPSVVGVTQTGVITALSSSSKGYSIVQVSPDVFYAGSNIFSTLKVVVADQLVNATSITVTAPANEVYAGETLQLSMTILPANATYRTVQWSSSNEAVATVDASGLVTGKVNSAIHADVTINATALDGSGIVASKTIRVNQIVQPLDVQISQTHSINNNYLFAISDKRDTLIYTTTPADCTRSLIEWSSSDPTIATVAGGVVTFNQDAVFGDVTITAKCPSTGATSSIKLRLEEGLLRELFHDKSNYNWYNATQSGNGTSSSHVWSYGKVTVTTYTQTSGTKQRADFKCWSAKTWLNAGKYPIIAIKMDDLKGVNGITARNITLDAAGTCNGTTYSGSFGGGSNKWLNDYKCSDGSHVFIYNLATQTFPTGGILPTTALATFTTLQFKYADIATVATQQTYNVYWVQSFKTIADVANYITSEGLTYEVIQ